MKFWLSLLFIIPLLQGCTPIGVVVGAAASAGQASVQDRGFQKAVDDETIEAKISGKWLQHNLIMFNSLSLNVYEGRAMITGYVSNNQLRHDAVRLAWAVDGVREVINEVEVGDGPTLAQQATDVVTANKLRASLLLDDVVQAINYQVEVINGTVYLIGIAQNKAELEHVMNEIRYAKNVNKVISHVRVKTDSEQ